MGAPAPDFLLRNQHGESISLGDLRGTPVLLVFFPWAFSRICTNELNDLSERTGELDESGVRLLAVSCDAIFTLRAYAESLGIAYDLLSDHWPHGAVASAYGVFDIETGASLRGTFLIDANGVIAWSTVDAIGQRRHIHTLLHAANQ